MLDLETLEGISKQFGEPNWVLEKRKGYFEQYKKLEIPIFKYGNGINVDVSYINFSNINPSNAIINNIIQTPDGIKVITIEEAIKENESLLKEFFISEEAALIENKLLALHGAFFNSSIIIKVPENFNSKKPVYLNLNLDSARIETVIIIASKNSIVKIIENSRSEDNKDIFRSHIVKIIAYENSYVEYVTLQNLGKKTTNFCKKYACVDSGASVYWVDCDIGSKVTQNLTSTFLNGDKAICKSLCIIFGEGNQCFDVHHSAFHLKSNTKSDILSRAVLNNNSKKVYMGLIEIKPDAKNCDGYQKSDVILLSDNAEANIMPNLKISNNDVKCSHGATISQIDKDKLFYMMSRGLLESAAIKAIVEGFFNPVFEKIKDKDIKEEIANSISERLERVK